MILFIIFLVYVFFSIIEFKKGVEADSTLINQVDRLEKDRSVLLDRISDLEKELRDVKIERNIFRDFVDEFLEDNKNE